MINTKDLFLLDAVVSAKETENAAHEKCVEIEEKIADHIAKIDELNVLLVEREKEELELGNKLKQIAKVYLDQLEKKLIHQVLAIRESARPYPSNCTCMKINSDEIFEIRIQGLCEDDQHRWYTPEELLFVNEHHEARPLSELIPWSY